MPARPRPLRCGSRGRSLPLVSVAVHGGDQVELDVQLSVGKGRSGSVIDVGAGRPHGQISVEIDSFHESPLVLPIPCGVTSAVLPTGAAPLLRALAGALAG